MDKTLLYLAKDEFVNTTRSWAFRLFMLMSVLFVAALIYRGPSSFEINDYLSEYFMVAKFVLIISGIYILGRDFSSGAYKYVFTGKFTTGSVLKSKIMASAAVGVLCWSVQILLKSVILFRMQVEGRIFDRSAFNSLVMYVVIAILIGSFAFLITAATQNIKIATILTLITFGFVQHIAPIFILFYEREALVPEWFTAIKLIPSYIIFDWMETFQLNFLQLVLMIGYSGICLFFSRLLLNKRDLNV